MRRADGWACFGKLAVRLVGLGYVFGERSRQCSSVKQSQWSECHDCAQGSGPAAHPGSEFVSRVRAWTSDRRPWLFGSTIRGRCRFAVLDAGRGVRLLDMFFPNEENVRHDSDVRDYLIKHIPRKARPVVPSTPSMTRRSAKGRPDQRRICVACAPGQRNSRQCRRPRRRPCPRGPLSGRPGCPAR